jgi:hypothetical protein
MELTTAWSVGGAFEHWWTPSMRTTVFSSYTRVQFNSEATSILCNSLLSPVLITSPGCSADWSVFDVGARQRWDLAPGYYLGVQVLYRQIDTAFANQDIFFPGGSGKPAGRYKAQDTDTWSGIVRIHRDFPY